MGLVISRCVGEKIVINRGKPDQIVITYVRAGGNKRAHLDFDADKELVSIERMDSDNFKPPTWAWAMSYRELKPILIFIAGMCFGIFLMALAVSNENRKDYPPVKVYVEDK